MKRLVRAIFTLILLVVCRTDGTPVQLQVQPQLPPELLGNTEAHTAAQPEYAAFARELSLLVKRATESAIAPSLAEISARLQSTDAAQNASIAELSRRLDTIAAERTTKSQENSSQLVTAPPRDCSDLSSGSPSGVYRVSLAGSSVAVYCDQETDGGGWTVFQRRADIQPREDFFRVWEDYKWGFGTLDAEFWWGLEHLWQLTAQLDRRYQLRVDLEDFEEGSRHALYQRFRISSEKDGYRLLLGDYEGDAGDSLSEHSGNQFTTKDRDNDMTNTGNCAHYHKGGWWYNKCHSSNLNGLYLSGEHTSYANGVNWHAWRKYQYSLKNVEMKIRPSKKL